MRPYRFSNPTTLHEQRVLAGLEPRRADWVLAEDLKLTKGKFTWKYFWSFGDAVGVETYAGSYRLTLTLHHDKNLFDAAVLKPDNRGTELSTKKGMKTQKAAEAWLDKEMAKLAGAQAAQAKVAAAAPAAPTALTPAALGSFLSHLHTKRGGSMRDVEVDERPYPGASARPQNYERLDHYTGSGWDQRRGEDDDPEGWDSDAWEEDYAGPLRAEVEKKLQAEFGDAAKNVAVEIGEKGHVQLQIVKRA